MAGLATMSAAADPLPVMVGDFNTTPAPAGDISALYAVGNQIFFLGKDTTHGTELWRSDGTTAGTWMVKDIVAGIQDSGVKMLGQTNGILLFSIESGKFAGVWRSDGTEEGTFRVAEVRARNPKSLGGLMWFVGTAPGAPYSEGRPWRTDGTAEGTWELDLEPETTAAVQLRSMVKPRTGVVIILPPGDIGADALPVGDSFARLGEDYWFIDGGRGLWKSGGIPETTGKVAELEPAFGSLVRLESVTNWLSLVSSGAGGDEGLDWWASDGTTGDLARLHDCTGWLGFTLAGRVGDEMVVMARLANGREFWRSDGTLAGTVRIAVAPATWQNQPTEFSVSNGKIFFSVETSKEGREPWILDPASGSLGMLKDIKPKDDWSAPSSFRTVGGVTYFIARDKSGQRIWTTTGQQSGTKSLGALLPKGWYPTQRLSSLGDTLFFVAHGSGQGPTLWRRDGNAKKAIRVASTGAGTGSFMPWSHVRIEELQGASPAIYFIGYNEDGALLWRSDGTAAGTHALESFRTYRNSYYSSSNPWATDGRVVFSGPDPLRRTGIALQAATDRPASAGLIAGIPKNTYPLAPSNFTRSGNRLYFVCNSRVWITDGTATGTHPLQSTGDEPGYPGFLVADGQGRVFFRDGNSTWIADANLGTTTKVDTGSVEFPVGREGSLFFLRATANVFALWRNDGDANGSTKVAELTGVVSGTVASVSSSAGLMWIDAIMGSGDTSYRELWRSDGTAEGTFQVGTFPRNFVIRVVPGIPEGRDCVFIAGSGMWTSDGTVEGTVLAMENPLPWESATRVVGNWIYFCGYDEVHGHELWRTDGTAAGTMMVADITGDSGSSLPAHFALAGNRLYFSAATIEAGREWYTLDVSAELGASAASD